MFGIEVALAEFEAANREAERQRKRMERDAYDVSLMRGPMIEADIDWRVPADYRPMVEGDL